MVGLRVWVVESGAIYMAYEYMSKRERRLNLYRDQYAKKSLHLQALKFKFNAAIARKKSGDSASWKRCHVDHAVTNGDVGGVVAS